MAADQGTMRGMARGLAVVAVAAGVVAAGVAVAGVPAGAHSARTGAPPGTATYIVTLESGEVAAADVPRVARGQLGQRPTRVFRSALRGYTAELTPAQADELAAEPTVRAVERDAVVTATTTQPNAPWGLDRTDQRALPLSSTYTYTATGAGVTAYVIDSGIRFSHQDLAGRAVSGYDGVDGGSADDCNGHGTHVSSTIGGATYGVAKEARLVAVRVLDCVGRGTLSGVIAGIDWAVDDHAPGQPAVANMSLGGPVSTALDTAVGRLVTDGVTVAVAAGNSSLDACSTSPARVPAALTVAASSAQDAFAGFSNRGACVDVIGPGVDVTAAWSTDDAAVRTVSGTSMASPHVAGAAAKVLGAYPGASPDAVASAVLGVATPDVVTGVDEETPNLLLYSDI